MRRFPDVQRELVADLAALVPDARHVGTQVPTDLAAALPFIRVWRRGGPRDRLNDTASVDIDVWDSTYDAASLLMEKVCERITGPRPSVLRFDRVEIPDGPRELPWSADRTVRRIGVTAQVVSRRYLDTT